MRFQCGGHICAGYKHNGRPPFTYKNTTDTRPLYLQVLATATDTLNLTGASFKLFNSVCYTTPQLIRTTTRLAVYRNRSISVMAPIEFHRYTDVRGDIIIFKFDADIAHNPDPRWPNDSAVSVCHHYIVRTHSQDYYHSILLPLNHAVERWRNDQQSLQPRIGMVMYEENASVEDGLVGTQLKMQYKWKGWDHGEGYRRGWARLCVQDLQY